METVGLSQQLQEFLHTEKIIVDTGLETVTRLLQMLAQYFYGLTVPSHWRLLDIQRGARSWYFRWRSDAEQAACPRCHVISRHLAHRLTLPTVQDLPCNGMTVYHTVIQPRYVCDQTECPVYTFVDPLAGFACPGARLSTRLKTLLIRLSLPSVINRMPSALQPFGIVVSRDTLIRLIKAQGAIVIADNLARGDVRVLDVDDANFRKGDHSTGHSVFVDGDTHRFLVVVQGTTQAIAEAVDSAVAHRRNRQSRPGECLCRRSRRPRQNASCRPVSLSGQPARSHQRNLNADLGLRRVFTPGRGLGTSS